VFTFSPLFLYFFHNTQFEGYTTDGVTLVLLLECIYLSCFLFEKLLWWKPIILSLLKEVLLSTPPHLPWSVTLPLPAGVLVLSSSRLAILFSEAVVVIIRLKPLLAKRYLGCLTYYRGRRTGIKESFTVTVWIILQSLDCRDRGFESSWGNECSSLVFVVCCVGSDFCDDLITRVEESYRVHVSNCVWSRNLNH